MTTIAQIIFGASAGFMLGLAIVRAFFWHDHLEVKLGVLAISVCIVGSAFYLWGAS